METKEETTETTKTTPRPRIFVDLICKELVLPYPPRTDAGTPGFYPRKPVEEPPYFSPASLVWGLGLWISGQQN
jgi:hypothetical protein